ncbi:PLC-like phosphodiesterase [Mycena rebaudengoi]|nr:PLC-like phosphodiesterase [Mycena rebaudengoi]
MPAFYPGVYNEGSYDKSITKARKDLEQDYPGCFVFIHSRESGKVKVIRKEPPSGQTNIVAGRFEIKAHTLFGRTFGYDYYVLAEGLLSYDGNTDPAYSTVSDGTVADMQVAIFPSGFPEPGMPPSPPQVFQMAYYSMTRRDGHPNRFRRTLFVDPTNWMGDSRIDGRRYLSEFTLPGTHNSHATGNNVPFPTNLPGIKGWVTCQSWGVRKQLELGVRFVDLRVGTGMKMVHGRSDLTGTLWDVMNELTGFLRDHPSETVTVSIKWDEESFRGTQVPEPASFGPDMEKMTRERGSWYTGTTIPTLDEVRGKMILLRRFGNSNLGLELGNQFKGPSSGPAPPGLDPKEQQWFGNKQELDWVKTTPNNRDTIWMTWLSSFNTGKNLNPWDFASYTNPMLQQYLEETNVPRAEKLGLVVVDFLDGLYTPGSGGRGRDSACFLSEKLILTNFD